MAFGGRPAKTHRVSYESFRGAVPAGLDLDHLCRVRHCVNPWHLEPVTRRVNLLRGANPISIAHLAGTCTRGHAMTPDNTYQAPGGQRKCRACGFAYRKAMANGEPWPPPKRSRKATSAPARPQTPRAPPPRAGPPTATAPLR
jgi:hypothetical protein